MAMKQMVVNGTVEGRVFAGFKEQQHLPSFKLDADEFEAVYGDYAKGDGFSIELDYDDVLFEKACYVVMIGDKPMRQRVDGKNVIVRTDTEEEALSACEGIRNATVISQYTYCSSPSVQLLGELREGEMLSQAVKLDKQTTASILG